MNSFTGPPNIPTADLIPEDDDLLSYFLSADPISEDIAVETNPQHSALPGQQTSFPRPTGVAMAPGAAFEPFTTIPMGPPSIASQFAMRPGSAPAVPHPVSALSQVQQQLLVAQTVETKTQSDSTKESKAEAPASNDSDEKRQRRLARNRESARQSRRRRKQYLELLEEKVTLLTEEIDNARREHLDKADSTLNEMKKKLLHSLQERASKDPSSYSEEDRAQLENGRKLLRERFGPDAYERRSVLKYQFDQLNSLILSPYTRFLLWMSIQDDSFFVALGSNESEATTSEEKVKRSEIWPLLSAELGLTLEQEEKIRRFYTLPETQATRIERRKITLAMSYLNRLQEKLLAAATRIQEQMEALDNILTPEQTIRYMSWVEQNEERISNQDILVNLVEENIAEEKEDKIAKLLKKPDREITVEDVTELLAALS